MAEKGRDQTASAPRSPMDALASSLASWTRTWTPAGIRFVGPGGGVLVTHGRPLPSCLLHDVLAPQGAAFCRGSTDEGEHALAFTAAGRRSGWVIGDRHMTVIEAETDAAGCTSFVDALVWKLPLRLGAHRARRFEIKPPPGWRISAHDLTVRLDAPQGDAFLTNPAAKPLGSERMLDKFLYEDVLVGVALVEPMDVHDVVTPSGIRGQIVRVTARHRDGQAPIVFWTAILDDDRFRYSVRLESSVPAKTPAHEVSFRAVVASMRPIPRVAARSLSACFPID